jgi:two-component system response regulator HydG
MAVESRGVGEILPAEENTGQHIPGESDGDIRIVPGTTLEEVEKLLVRATLEMVGGNRRLASELLGIGERTLYRKIKDYGLS